jgi:hypothetical protein
MSSLNLSLLVSPDLGHGLVVGSVVILDGNLSGHASHSGDLSLVACLNEKLDVGFHEGDSHGDIGSVRHDIGLGGSELLDAASSGSWQSRQQDDRQVSAGQDVFHSLAEDVIPSTTIQTGRVISQLVKNLFHLESGGDRLDQDRGSNQTVREPDISG